MMVLVREDNQARRDIHGLQDAIKFQSVAVRHTIVDRAMRDQRRSLEVLRVEHWILALHALHVVPRRAADDFGKAMRSIARKLAVRIVYAGVIDDAGKTVRM